MLKNKVDEHIEHLSFTLAMSEDEIRVLRTAFEDIVREAVGEMIGREKGDSPDMGMVEMEQTWGYDLRVREEKAKAEEILNQLK